MLFWLLALAVTAVACAALYYAAAGRTVNATAGLVDDATAAHFRQQLREIDADIAVGRMGEAEAGAARGEMARELIRLKGDGARQPKAGAERRPLLLAIAASAVLAFGAYSVLGSPDLPGMPLSERAERQMSLADAVARVEAQLLETPDDVRGWTVVAPVYMQLGRFGDAVTAYRRIIELSGATADSETDLAEAIMMSAEGSLEGEPLALLRSAAARDPAHVRSRFYLAGEATRAGEYQAAIGLWNEIIELAEGDEPWLDAARAGLETAMAGINGTLPRPGEDEIAAMVEGLSARLEAEGGSIAEWTQLVRSRLVLGQTELAQAAYDAARAAYPDAGMRTELDVLAADNGLIAR